MMTKAVKIGGTIVAIGMPGKMLPFNVMECVMKELDIKGVRIHAQNNFAAAVDIIQSGVMNESLEKIITHEFTMDDIERAFTFSLKDTEHMKVIIKI
jgi:threonine dehydrogenase-like Zn-dependent dehydrogenase